jgi:hypothetical protein
MYAPPQLFMTHAWGPDECGRDTHERVARLAVVLRAKGWTCWVDEEQLFDHLDGGMARGIEQATAVIACLTRRYASKVSQGVREPNSDDNCLKEFNYAFALRKPVVPVVMERSMLRTTDWPLGVVTMRLAMHVYIDGTDDDLVPCAHQIDTMLRRRGMRPAAPVAQNRASCRRRRARSACVSTSSRPRTVVYI